MKLQRVIIAAAVLLLIATGIVSAQNLLTNNPHAQRARQLRQQSEAAFNEGEFQRSIELAQESEQESRLAREWADRMAWAYRANGARNRANERLTAVRRVDAATNYPEEYNNAVAFFEEGQRLFTEERYEPSFNAFRNVLTALEGVRAVAGPAVTPTGVLPRYYTVRRIPERRDSFWRIAEYDFVYGDPWQWRRLYEVNRHMLQDPDNPDLIQPGMVFEIPSIRGERREGVWQPPR